jgi:hypothetical protein
MAMKKDDRFTIKIKRANLPVWRALQGITGESMADEVIKKAWEELRNQNHNAPNENRAS